MIDRQYGFLIFVCDDCGNAHVTGTKDFEKAWAEAKEEGWTATRKSAGGWTHWCNKPCTPS
jgi:hypothetical protein